MAKLQLVKEYSYPLGCIMIYLKEDDKYIANFYDHELEQAKEVFEEYVKKLQQKPEIIAEVEI